MKKKIQLKRGLICIGIVAVEVLIYLGISRYIAGIKAEEARYFRTENEFLRTIDCAELFDAYPGHSFELKFEICAEKPGEILVYQQNGSSQRYFFSEKIEVSSVVNETDLGLGVALNKELRNCKNERLLENFGRWVIPRS